MTTTHQKTAHLTDIDPAYFDVRLDDDALSSSHIEALESGVTPVHRQNIDEQRIDELSSVKEDNEQMKAQIALLMQQAGLTK